MSLSAKKLSPEKNHELRVELGNKLKAMREAAGLSQRGLADKLSLEYYTFVSQLETGRGRIPVHRYGEWAEALNQNPREFTMTLLSYYEPSTWNILFGK